MLKQIEFKGISVNYEYRKNTGKPTVILLHGFLECLNIWGVYVKELAKNYNVLNIDLLGHGKSDCTAYIHTMEEMAESVRAVMKNESIIKGVFVGHSLGGYVSLAFAELYPDNIKGLCLFNSSALDDSSTKKKDRDRAIKLIKSHHERFIKEAVPYLFVELKTAKQKRDLKRMLKYAMATPKQGIIAALEGMKIRINREIVLRFAPCPVFFVIGQQDKLLDFNVLIEQSKLNKKGSYFLSETGGHLCFLDDTYPCLLALQKFIRSI